MPIARFEMPDGRIARFEVPEGTTPEQAQEMMQEHFAEPEAPQTKAEPTRDQEIKSNFLSRLGFGAMEPIAGTAQLVAHGLDAIAAPGSMAEGLGETVDNYWKQQKQDQLASNEATGVGFDAAGLAGNVLSPVNALIPGGSANTLLGKTGVMAAKGGAIGAMLPSYGDDYGTDKAKQIVTNALLGGAMPIAGEGIKKGAGYLADIIGGIGTHTGGEPLKTAARAGFQGGNAADSFLNNMRENVPKTEVLDDAKMALQNMGQAKNEAYKQGMAQVSGDNTVLKFDGIDNAINKAYDTVTYKGQVKNRKGADTLQAMADEIAKWKALPPEQYHTPEGLDALKQKIAGIQESIPFEERTAKMVAGNIYNSVKGEIAKQAPVYNKVMKDYSEGTEAIREIEKSLSLGKKATDDTAMRKLQSIMRNNVNTSYGNRIDSVNTLQDNGAANIMDALAGQALSSKMPRGLGNLQAGGTVGASYLMGNPLAAIPALALQSPRLMGEAAYYGGKGANLLDKGLAKIPAKQMISQYLINKLQEGN